MSSGLDPPPLCPTCVKSAVVPSHSKPLPLLKSTHVLIPVYLLVMPLTPKLTDFGTLHPIVSLTPSMLLLQNTSMLFQLPFNLAQFLAPKMPLPRLPGTSLSPPRPPAIHLPYLLFLPSPMIPLLFLLLKTLIRLLV